MIGQRVVAALAEAEARVRKADVLSEVTFDLRSWAHRTLHTESVTVDLTNALHHVLERVDVARMNHALALDPIDTGSITEDMATAMRLHSLGWTSVYHHEVLVHGLAPEDIRTMLSQRERWAAGTMQVFFSNNPVFIRGLTIGQRLMYLSTMTSYLNGFAAVVYIAAPVVFLTTGVFPIHADSRAFFFYFHALLHLLPSAVLRCGQPGTGSVARPANVVRAVPDVDKGNARRCFGSITG